MINNYNGSGIDILEQGDEADWGPEYTNTTKAIIDKMVDGDQLIKVTEDTRTGWTIRGVSRVNKATIGQDSIDFSFAD